MSLYYNLKRTTVKKIAILASGSGSNAENIANYFKGSDYAEVSFIIANNPDAYVIERAKRLGIEYAVVTKAQFMEADSIIDMLKERDIDFVVLAGFLVAAPVAWVIVSRWLEQFANRITVPWWVFIASLMAVLALTVALVSLRSWKAASENPAEVVRGL